MLPDVLLMPGMVTAAVFVLVLLVEGARRSGYDPVLMTASELSLGERGWVQRVNFFQVGVGTLAFALGVNAAIDAVVGSILLAVFGLGFIGSGLLLPDPLHGYPPEARGAAPRPTTWHGRLHNAIGPVMFIAVFLACLALATQLEGIWQLYTLATAAAGIGLTVLTARAFMRDAPTTGLIQRILVVVYLAWLVLLGGHLI
jgi:hypothetical protein